jgi:2'-hydroxyisoflavone reductase
MSNRRDFLKVAALTGSALHLRALSGQLLASGGAPASAPLRILILGGTGFTGPYQVRYSVSRGHKVTVFNRNRRQADLPSGVERLVGDRNAPDGLAALKGRTWDVVIDNPTTFPRWVRDAGQVLKDATQHYVFISTISVYPDVGTPRGADESAAVAQYKGTDPFAEARITGENYGPLKALSEREAEKWFPRKTTVIRPGLIVGPGDESDRFTYWPVRIDRGGEILAPGDGLDPIQFIDARDLAEWTIRMVEQKTFGTFNATGPRAALNSAEFLGGMRAALSGSKDLKFVWVPAAFLAEQKVEPWGDLPVWIPRSQPDSAISTVSITRAVAQGLTFRPLATTTVDALAWFNALPAERKAALRAGLKPEREAEVLKVWKEKND